MLFCLIAIKFYQLVQMMLEAFKMGSLRVYARELGHELSLEFQDIKMIEAVILEANQLRRALQIVRDRVVEKLMPILMYLSPLAPRFTVILKVLHESIKETTAQPRDVVKT